MEELEYKKKLNELETDFESAKKKLHIEFGLSQAKYKVGDIIKYHRWALLVDKITVYKGFGLPEPVYHGVELKKDLTPRANGNRVAIHGNNGVEFIKST